MLRRRLAATALSLALLGRTALLASAQTGTAGGVDISNVWARATPAKAENGAAYLTMTSIAGDTLTGASTPVADKAELHRMTLEGNVMKMRPLPAIELPAGQPVTLKPGALHIMLFGLKRQLHPGDKFPLTLDFAKAGTREVEVTVGGGVAAMGPAGSSSGGSSMPMPMPPASAQH